MWRRVISAQLARVGRRSPLSYLKIEKSPLNLGKNTLIAFIYEFNFSFKMLLLAFSGGKTLVTILSKNCRFDT